MADYDSSLPVRTEAAGDIDIFISDATVSTQKLKVNADGSIDTNFAAGSSVEITDGVDTLAVNGDGSINAVVTATDLDIRDLDASQDNVAISDGTDTLAVNADGSINTNFPAGSQIEITDGTDTLEVNGDGSINAVVTATDLDIRDLTHVSDSIKIGDGTDFLAVNADGSINATVTATDLDIRDLVAATDSVAAHLFDEAGTAFSASNPLPVSIEESEGDEIVDYNTSATVAKDASVNHDYTVTAAKTFIGEEAWISGSGKLKVEMLVNAVPVFVGFNSTSDPNIRIPLEKIVTAAATQVVRLTITNKDNQAQDLYSTLLGTEV